MSAFVVPEVIVDILDADSGALDSEVEHEQLEDYEWRVTVRVANRGAHGVEGAVRLSVSIP